MRYLIGILLLASSLHAQTAKVVALTPGETAQQTVLLKQQQEINNKLALFRDAIAKKYLVDDKLVATGQSCPYQKGWGCGDFEFSEDYKYIVPSKSLGLNITTTAPTCAFPRFITPATGILTGN